MYNMKEEYNEILSKISELQVRKAELEKLMLESTDLFHEKVKLWYEGDDEGHHDYYIDFPLLLAEFEKLDERRRGKTYYLPDLVGGEDEFWLFCEGEEDSKWFNRAEYLKAYKPAIEEAMKNNMKSFVADW
jgi:hypothetical protein